MKLLWQSTSWIVFSIVIRRSCLISHDTWFNRYQRARLEIPLAMMVTVTAWMIKCVGAFIMLLFIPIEIIVVEGMHCSSPDRNNQKRSRRDWFVSSPAIEPMAAIRLCWYEFERPHSYRNADRKILYATYHSDKWIKFLLVTFVIISLLLIILIAKSDEMNHQWYATGW